MHSPIGFDVTDAGENDLPGILEIYNEVIATSTAVYSETPATLAQRRDWWTARVGQGYPVLVARDPAGSVVGFSTFGDFRPFPGYRFTVEHTVHVATSARGQGIGAALVRELFPHASRLGKHIMIGAIDAANGPSIRLHERLGFERAAVLKEVGFKFNRWLDLLFMTKSL